MIAFIELGEERWKNSKFFRPASCQAEVLLSSFSSSLKYADVLANNKDRSHKMSSHIRFIYVVKRLIL